VAAEKILASDLQRSAFEDEYLLAVITALRANTSTEPDHLRLEAIDRLGKSIDLGFRNHSRLQRDSAFQSLRDLPEFQELLEKLH
jgi:hypothetical protein